jgi:hypothetical protein
MRWKLLWRRLSVSAPRVAIRSRLPWPLRWAVAAMMLGFSAAMALWAFEFGRTIAGFDRGVQQDLLRLRAEVEQLRDENRRALQVSHTAESLLTTERTAQARLAQQVQQLEEANQSLQADLGFFENLLPTSGDEVQLRALQAQPRAPGELRFQMLVVRNGKQSPEFVGRYDLMLGGTLDGRPWTLALPGGARPLTVRQYARVEAMIDHPPLAMVKSVQVRVTDAQGATRAAQTLKLRSP